MKYVPKGGMCATCIHRDRNCMGLKFSKMPIIRVTDDLTIVKCTEYERNNCKHEISDTFINEEIKPYMALSDVAWLLGTHITDDDLVKAIMLNEVEPNIVSGVLTPETEKWVGIDQIIKEYSNDHGFCLHLVRELLPDTHQVVPIEPTESMLERGLAYCGTRSSLDQAYAAMLQAAQEEE